MTSSHADSTRRRRSYGRLPRCLLGVAILLLSVFALTPRTQIAGAADLAPVNTTLPVVSDAAGNPPIVGDTLTTTNGVWNNVPTGFTYQWYATGRIIVVFTT